MRYQGTEYEEYKPNTKYWNNTIFHKKLKNISKVINDLDSDIITLQEIESKYALDELKKYISKKYKYSKFIKNKTSAIGVAILSIYPFVKNERVEVNKYDKYTRDILKSTILIDNKPLIIYVNHWRSKRSSESKRVVYATALRDDILKLPKYTDYIIIGDLNADYNEFQTFKYNKKLNDTYGITGINQVLNTTIDENFVKKSNILGFEKNVHYNLWLDIRKKDRFSLKFRGENGTPDNIIVSKGLFDNKNISYVDKSFEVFKPDYLYKKGKINRWNKRKSKGYSDHLPIKATFTTTKQNSYPQNNTLNHNKKIDYNIDYLYSVNQLNKSIEIKKAIVIYKSNKINIIKQKNNRAILVYNPPFKTKLGEVYNITIDKIDEYNGLKEIKEISYSKKIGNKKNYKRYYLDGSKIDLFNIKYQNEIITNLKGVYKKRYLYYKYKGKELKIRLYFKDKNIKPKDGDIITILSGHLSIYKSKIQIVLFSNNDFI